MKREGHGETMMSIADMTADMKGHGSTGYALNVKKEGGCGVKKRDVGFVGLNVIVMSAGMTGIEDTER